MTIRDDRFLQPDQPEEFATQREIEFLRGVVNPQHRAAAEMGYQLSGADDWQPYVGCNVEYALPDNITRVGSLCRPDADGTWLVQVDEGEYQIVPLAIMQPTASLRVDEHRAAVQAAMAETVHWEETRTPVWRDNDHFALTIDYGAFRPVPSDESLQRYVASKYAAIVVDAEAANGKMSVICRQADIDGLPSDDLDDTYPLSEEGIEGTGKVGYIVETVRRFAKRNPSVSVTLGDISEEPTLVRVAFSLSDAEGKQLYIGQGGEVTPIIAEGHSPAVGFFDYRENGSIQAGLHTAAGDMALSSYGLHVDAQVEPPYSSGTGPLTVKEDADDAEDGDYIVKADKAVTQTEEDGESRGTIAEPGEVVAELDPSATEYWETYYGEYGEMLTRDPRKAELVEAWTEVAGEPPTVAQMLRLVAALSTHHNNSKTAQVAPGSKADAAKAALELARQDDGFKARLDKQLTKIVAKDPSLLTSLDPGMYAKLLYGAMLQDVGNQSKIYSLLSSRKYRKRINEMLKAQNAAPLEQPAPAPEQAEAPAEDEPAAEAAPGDTVTLPAGTAVRSPTGGAPTTLDEETEALIQSESDQGMVLVHVQQGGKRTPYLVEKTDMPQAPAATPAQQAAPQVSEQPAPQAPAQDGPPVPSLGQRGKQFMQRLQKGLDRLTPAQRATERAIQRSEEPGALTEDQRLDWERRNPLQRGAATMNRQPAKHDFNIRIDNISSQGSVLKMTLTFDPDQCEGMSDSNIRHQLISFVKGEESKKEYRDLGFLGKPRFSVFDPDLGMAEILVRSSEAEQFPSEVTLVGTEFEDKGNA